MSQSGARVERRQHVAAVDHVQAVAGKPPLREAERRERPASRLEQHELADRQLLSAWFRPIVAPGSDAEMGSLKAFQPTKRLSKKARRGFRGYPVATIAFYGPDDRRASKVAVGIMLGEGEEAAELQRWTSDDRDVRNDPAISEAVLDLIGQFDVKTVAMTDRIIGCPHEEGIDYEGPVCPHCPFWANRDRLTGEIIQ